MFTATPLTGGYVAARTHIHSRNIRSTAEITPISHFRAISYTAPVQSLTKDAEVRADRFGDASGYASPKLFLSGQITGEQTPAFHLGGSRRGAHRFTEPRPESRHLLHPVRRDKWLRAECPPPRTSGTVHFSVSHTKTNVVNVLQGSEPETRHTRRFPSRFGKGTAMLLCIFPLAWTPSWPGSWRLNDPAPQV